MLPTAELSGVASFVFWDRARDSTVWLRPTPPKSRHVREKARLGRPMGFTPWSNEECTIILDHIRYKKFEEKENKTKTKIWYREILALERLWRLQSISVRRVISKFPKFESMCIFPECDAWTLFFRSGTPRQSPKTPDCRKEKFAVEIEPPHSNDVQHRNSKWSHEDLRVKNKN